MLLVSSSSSLQVCIKLMHIFMIWVLVLTDTQAAQAVLLVGQNGWPSMCIRNKQNHCLKKHCPGRNRVNRYKETTIKTPEHLRKYSYFTSLFSINNISLSLDGQIKLLARIFPSYELVCDFKGKWCRCWMLHVLRKNICFVRLNVFVLFSQVSF